MRKIFIPMYLKVHLCHSTTQEATQKIHFFYGLGQKRG